MCAWKVRMRDEVGLTKENTRWTDLGCVGNSDKGTL